MQYTSYIGSFSTDGIYFDRKCQYQRFLNIFFGGDDSVAQLVALMSGVVLGGVAEVVGSNLARGKTFTASIGSVDSLYPSVFIYCLNLHQFLILCCSKAMMFVKELLAIRRIFSLVNMINNIKFSNCPNVFEIGVVWQ